MNAYFFDSVRSFADCLEFIFPLPLLLVAVFGRALLKYCVFTRFSWRVKLLNDLKFTELRLNTYDFLSSMLMRFP